MKNITLLGTDNYPKTTTAAYDELCHHKKPTPPRQVHAPPPTVLFVQSGDTDLKKTVPVNDRISFPEVICYCCQETGRYAGNFPSSTAKTHTESQSLHVGLTMTQTTKDEPTTNIINPNWILLYTCSTISYIINKNIFQNIQPCDAG